MVESGLASARNYNGNFFYLQLFVSGLHSGGLSGDLQLRAGHVGRQVQEAEQDPRPRQDRTLQGGLQGEASFIMQA